MSRQSDSFNDNFVELLLLTLDGKITDEQFKSLQDQIIHNPEARECYYQFMATYVGFVSYGGSGLSFFKPDDTADEYSDLLAKLAEEEIKAPVVPLQKTVEEVREINILKSPDLPVSRKVSKISVASILATAAAVIFFFLFPRFVPVGDRTLVGKLSRQVDARWETELKEIVDGEDLYAGTMKLVTGFAEIELDSGANVIIEGPAEFTLELPNQLYLRQGRLVVKINKTSENPFVVHSPHASIVDYGTEFGVQVDDASNTLTHVYQGKVELRCSDSSRINHSMELTQNQAGVANAQGQLIPNPGAAGLFVRQREFETKMMAGKGSAYHQWLDYSYRLRRDPDLVAYYTFEYDKDNPARLTNMANATSGILNGTLDSVDKASLPTWVKGRWPQTTALSFDRTDMQYVEIPGNPAISINGPITIAVWVDCSGAKDGGHIVSNRVGARSLCNYQFGYRSPVMSGWKQGMHLARKAKPSDAENQMCSKALPATVGWTLLAVTHDNDTLKFYFNGRLVETKNWPHQQELAEGGLLIGSDFSPDDPSRFNGKIGEIVIAKRIFTEKEISEMYEAGKP